MDGAMRSCNVTNPIGTCWGTQTCAGSTGWSACTAQTPATETCDGADNDCNFVIDDGVGGGTPCTNDVPGVGSCPGTLQCAGASGFVCSGPMPMLESCNFLDDDCDSNVDEAFPGLGDLCTDGVGACQNYGSVRCNAAGSGTECSATAGSPTTELCNLIDDDCDTNTDENFPTLGNGCSVGLGVCQRFGTVVCNGSGSSTQCSATPGSPTGAETCNYQDDNCNGQTDEGFKNVSTGLYDQDTTCGSCENDCTVLYNGPNAFGSCTVMFGTAQCEMGCDAGYYDLNGSTLDGCEFQLDTTSIYVSTSDPTAVNNTSCGLGPSATGGHPCKTIAYSFGRAAATGRPNLIIADGTYSEAVTLVNGVNLYGGYRADTWERHLVSTATVIDGISTSGNHDRTVIASGITSPTIFEGFVVRGSFNAKVSGNSYAIYVSGSSDNLTVRRNVIFAGRGGPGAGGPS